MKHQHVITDTPPKTDFSIIQWTLEPLAMAGSQVECVASRLTTLLSLLHPSPSFWLECPFPKYSQESHPHVIQISAQLSPFQKSLPAYLFIPSLPTTLLSLNPPATQTFFPWVCHAHSYLQAFRSAFPLAWNTSLIPNSKFTELTATYCSLSLNITSGTLSLKSLVYMSVPPCPIHPSMIFWFLLLFSVPFPPLDSKQQEDSIKAYVIHAV